MQGRSSLQGACIHLPPERDSPLREFYGTGVGICRREEDARDRGAPRATFGFVLPKKNQEFYHDLSNALRAEIENIHDLPGTVIIRYAETQDPAEYAAQMGEMIGTADVVGASAVNRALVRRAVEALTGAGIPVLTMLNDFAPGVRRNFIRLDNYRPGRQAA